MSVEVEEVEQWKNATKGLVYVTKRNLHGNVGNEAISPGGVVKLTTEERMINQDAAASDNQDLFKNGTLASVSLVESAADYEEVASNPNSMSDDDLRGLFGLTLKEFKAAVTDIQNIRVLDRLNSFVETAEVDATVAQGKALTARLTELGGDDRKKFANATGDIPEEKLRR